MRLTPIEQPSTLLLRFAYWFSRRKLGKVMMPLKVVYSRMPQLLTAHRKLLMMMEDDRHLPDRLRDLVSTWVSTLNGCSFCADLHQAVALHEHALDPKLLRDLAQYETAPGFTEAERAALAYAEETTLYKQVEDATFERLQMHFGEPEIVYLTWFVAMTNYLNLMAKPLGIESDGFCAMHVPYALEASPVAEGHP